MDDETPPAAPAENIAPTTASDIAPEVQTIEAASPPAEPEPSPPESAAAPAHEPSVEVPVEQTPSPPSEPTSQNAQPPNIVQELLIKARAKIQDKKRKKLDKIAAELNMRGRISNHDVQKLLRTSDATAARYLATLAKEGRVKRVGTTGRGVFYAKP